MIIEHHVHDFVRQRACSETRTGKIVYTHVIRLQGRFWESENGESLKRRPVNVAKGAT